MKILGIEYSLACNTILITAEFDGLTRHSAFFSLGRHENFGWWWARHGAILLLLSWHNILTIFQIHNVNRYLIAIDIFTPNKSYQLQLVLNIISVIPRIVTHDIYSLSAQLFNLFQGILCISKTNMLKSLSMNVNCYMQAIFRQNYFRYYFLCAAMSLTSLLLP